MGALASCADSVLDLSEAIKRYHDELNLPPSVSEFNLF